MSSASHRHRPAKRRRVIGQPLEDEEYLLTPKGQAEAPSASALSTRKVPQTHIPSLTAVCIRGFAEKLRELAKDRDVFDGIVRPYLQALPDSLVSRVFGALRTTCPTVLSHGFIAAYFLRGDDITLERSMPGVKRATIAAIAESSSRSTLRELVLTGFDKESDNVFASLLTHLPGLRTLNLRSCAKVGSKTVEAAAKNCRQLTAVNLNYTSVTPISLVPLISECRDLEVLKLAGIPNWNDTAFMKLLDRAAKDLDGGKLKLRTLKVRQSALTDASIGPGLLVCPDLKRLDISFTGVSHLSTHLQGNLLEKLSITSTRIYIADLITTVSRLPHLKVLNIGALGGAQGTRATNTTEMTFTDQGLFDLSNALAHCADLERVNLVGNTKLGFTGRRDTALAYFIRQVGRRLKYLNLANISSLGSSDLAGLIPEGDQDPSPLVTLVLNNTGVGDEATLYISSCSSLRTLGLAGTKFTNAGLYPIIDSCTTLEELDLTSCRGVPVADRRRFFEVWEQEWRDKSA